MFERQHVANGVGRRERHGGGSDDAGVDQGDREHHARRPPRIFAEASRDRAGVGEGAEFRLAVKGGGGEVVEIGSKVIVQKEGTKEEKTYVIVGSEEADMSQGKISNHSPVGVALFGKKKGDRVSFKTPNGTVNYKIVSVS